MNQGLADARRTLPTGMHCVNAWVNELGGLWLFFRGLLVPVKGDVTATA